MQFSLFTTCLWSKNYVFTKSSLCIISMFLINWKKNIKTLSDYALVLWIGSTSYAGNLCDLFAANQ